MAGIDDKVKITVELDAHNVVPQLATIRSALAGVGAAGTAGMGAIQAATSGLLGPLAAAASGIGGLVAGAVSLHAVFEALKHGIANADYLRDLHASVQAVSSSAAAGEEAFQRLEKAAQATRVTGNQLVQLYGQMLPLAMDKGLSEIGAQKFVTQIAKLAPAIGRSVEEAMGEAAQILAGRVRKTNLLAHVLGLDPAAYTAGLQTLESVFPKLDELAAKGEKMGQTFDSTFAKIKDALLDTFGEGFNEARDGVTSGLDVMKNAFEDPALLGAVRDLGREIANLVPIVLDVAKKTVEAFTGIIEGIRRVRETAKETPSGIGSAPGSLQGALDSLADMFLSTPGGGPADAGKGQDKLINDLKKIAEYQSKFDQAYKKTGQELAKNEYGPAIPSLLEYVGAVDKAAAAQKHWSSELAGTGEVTKPFKDLVDQTAKAVAEAERTVRSAQLSFDKLFAKPETDPLMKALTDLRQNADALRENLSAAAEKFDLQAAAEKTTPGVRTASVAAANALREMIGKIDEASAKQAQFLQDDFLSQALQKDIKAIQAADAAFAQFIETSVRGFDELGTGGGIGEAVRRQLEELGQAQHAALEQAKQELAAKRVLGLSFAFELDPAEVKRIEQQYADFGRDLVAKIKTVLGTLTTTFQDAVGDIFAAVEPGKAVDVVGQISAAGDAFARSLSASTGASLGQAYKTVQPILNKSFEEAARKAAEQFRARLDQFAGTMADLFTAGVTGGAQGFAQAASSLFLKGVNDGAKGIFKGLALVAFGAPPDKATFKGTSEEFAKASQESAQQLEKITAVISGAIAAVGQTISIFAQAKKGEEVSVVGTTLSFAAMGASIGSVFSVLGAAIGAVIGALAGLTISLLANAKARKEQPYAAYGIRDGVPFVEPFGGKEKNFANVTQGMMNDMLSQMTHVLEDTRNSYVKLLFRFGMGIATDITAANFAPTMKTYQAGGVNFMKLFWGALTGAVPYLVVHGFGTPRKTVETPGSGDIGNPLIPGKLGKQAQKNFMQDFQNWVNNTLPKDIIASFEAPLAEGFAGLGLAAGKFHEIWDRLQAIDPKDAIASLNNLFDALSAFRAIEEDRGKHIYGGAGFVFEGGYLEEGFAANRQSFEDQLAQSGVALVDFGAQIELLIGPEQIAAAKEWGDTLLDRQERIKQFFRELASAIDGVVKSYEGSIRELTLQGFKTPEGAPDVNAQVNFLKDYADKLVGQIKTAPTIGAATALSEELRGVILRIQQLGGAQSAEAAEAYRLWALGALQDAQNLVVQRLQELGEAVAAQQEDFLDAIQELIDAFRAAAEAITETTTTTTATGDDAVPDTYRNRPGREGAYVVPTQYEGAAVARRAESANSEAAVLEELRMIRRFMANGRFLEAQVDIQIDGQSAGTAPLADTGSPARRAINGRYDAA